MASRTRPNTFRRKADTAKRWTSFRGSRHSWTRTSRAKVDDPEYPPCFPGGPRHPFTSDSFRLRPLGLLASTAAPGGSVGNSRASRLGGVQRISQPGRPLVPEWLG